MLEHGSGVDEAANAGGYDSGSIIRQKDLQEGRPYKFRLLEPIIPFHRVMYPCAVPDKDDPNRLVQSWRSVRLPLDYKTKSFAWTKEPTIIDLLRVADLEVRRESKVVGVSSGNIRSQFDYQRVWAIPVFDRQDSDLQIKYLEVGWFIMKELKELKDALDEDNPSNLSHGPHWCWDVVITKVVDNSNPNKPLQFRVSYSLKSAKNNPVAGKIPQSIYKAENRNLLTELYENSVEMGIFTQEEKDLIDIFEVEAEMLPHYQPNTSEEIIQQFMDAPLCLDATMKDGSTIFPNAKLLAEKISTNIKQIEASFLNSVPEQLPQFAGTKDSDSQGAEVPTSSGEPMLDPDKKVEPPKGNNAPKEKTGKPAFFSKLGDLGK